LEVTKSSLSVPDAGSPAPGAPAGSSPTVELGQISVGIEGGSPGEVEGDFEEF
jgi:hypothetical protein